MDYMNKSAILHIPLSQYAFVSSEDTLTIRVRAAKDDLTNCTLYYGDRCCTSSPVDFYPLDMKVFASDGIFDYYEITFQTPFTRVCYYFKLEKEEEWTYYYADHFTQKLPDIVKDGHVIEGRSEYYQYPFILRSEIPDVPLWLKEAVVYNIFPDSFASGKKTLIGQPKSVPWKDGINSTSKLGGTINGIRENLDYINEIGFNTIYLNPIFVAGECHKYDSLDYFHIDPCFGSDEDFRRLVKELHSRDMRIIIDGVFNHSSWYFPLFEDVVLKGEKSEYANWFYDLTFPVVRPGTESQVPNYACFAYERKMPKLNTSNPQVQEYFAKVGSYWIREFGVDGWRLDVANEIDRNFWRMFRKAVKDANPEAVLVGEVWENSETWLKGDAFDSTMNYDFRKICREFFALGEINAREFGEEITKMLLRYPTNITLGQLNLLDTHDVPRFLSLCDGNRDKYKTVLLFLLLFPGPPSLFYGDEKGIMGITEPQYRSPMPWEETDEKLTDFIKKVIAIRKTYTDYTSVYSCESISKDSDSGLFIFSRKGKKGNIKVILNVSEKEEILEQEEVTELKHIGKCKGKYLLQKGVSGNCVEPYGYAVIYMR